MSTITGTITHSVTIGSGTYSSPLTRIEAGRQLDAIRRRLLRRSSASVRAAA
jgi:hypothetical protein